MATIKSIYHNGVALTFMEGSEGPAESARFLGKHPDFDITLWLTHPEAGYISIKPLAAEKAAKEFLEAKVGLALSEKGGTMMAIYGVILRQSMFGQVIYWNDPIFRSLREGE